jgi:hypothetical protein
MSTFYGVNPDRLRQLSHDLMEYLNDRDETPRVSAVTMIDFADMLEHLADEWLTHANRYLVFYGPTEDIDENRELTEDWYNGYLSGMKDTLRHFGVPLGQPDAEVDASSNEG